MHRSKLIESHPEEYRILRYKWGSMITRCTNPKSRNYINYGKRGITVCDEWRKFSNFFEWSLNNGFKIGLSLDRIDTNKNYCPENCQYITMEAQQQNRRNNRSFIDPFDGEELCLAAIAKKYNIPEETFRKRIDKYNMPLEKAITKLNGQTVRWRVLTDPFDNEQLCLTDLARKYNLSPGTLNTRIKNGWSLEDALAKPVDKRMAHKHVAV